jgi:Protein kinase domain/PASTA domain
VANFGERYELVRLIGSGGMGEVWLAHDERLADRPVAIKIMHKHMLPNADDVARFEREARLAAMMDHPNIVTVYTTGSYDGAPFMVMEYLRGQDLEKARLDGGAERIAAIGRDTCGALAYAHGKGVIHRDVKPANLFLCDTGQVKVTDFGIARGVSATTLSTPGVLVGTFAYMAPEQWRGDAPAFGNDVWAVGCVLYRLIAGRPPRVLPDAAGYAAAAVRGDPVPDLRDIAGAPGWLAAAVMAMLDPDPASRPAAADCVRLLAGPAASPAPVAGPGAPLAGTPLAGGAGAGPASAMAGGPGRPQPGRVADPARQDPPTAWLPPPAAGTPAGPASPGRRRRPGRVGLVAGALAALLAAGLVGAWALRDSPPADAPVGPATTSTSPSAPVTSAPARTASPTRSAAAPSSPAPAPSATATPGARATASAPAATGPALVPVPDVVGMTFAKARLVLLGDGFRVAGEHARLGQIVTSTSPSGQAPAGSVIVVVYGTGR